jgi:hypothetical protein
MPYPGPYSFNGMGEHLWPAHNVDAGLLIYHSDGNQIYQALPPQQIGFHMDSSKLFCQGLVASPMEEIIDSSGFLNTTPTTSALPLTNSLSHSWAAPNVSHCPCGTGLVGPDGCAWKGDVEVDATTKAMLETPFIPHISHIGGQISNVSPEGAFRYDSSHPSTKSSAHKRHATQHRPLKTVPKSLISELCDMSAQLRDMSYTVPVADTDSRNMLGAPGFTRSSSQSMVPSGIVASSQGSNQSSNSSGGQSPVGSTHDRCFPMDGLFAVSRNFIQTVQIACHGQEGESGQTSTDGFNTTISGEPILGTSSFTGTNSSKPSTMADTSNDRVDAESFVALADSTYAALLDVYQRVFHLVDVTANSDRPPSPPYDGSSNSNNRSNRFMRTSKADLKQSLHSAAVSSFQKDEAALSCLKVCRFPDVSVGGFPIVSTPAMQLGLGLRLADDFLSHFSHAVAAMHKCFSSTTHGDNVAAGAVAEQQQHLPTGSSSYLPHPPLVISEDLFLGHGFGAPIDWDTPMTATSASSSSGNNSLFSLQYGLSMHRPSSMDGIVFREHDLRQVLADLRNKLAA